MFQMDGRHQHTEGINSMVFKQRKYMGNDKELHYGLIIRVNISDFREYKGQRSKKMLIGNVT